MLGLKKMAEELYEEGENVDVEEIVSALFPNPPWIVFCSIEQVSGKELACEDMVKSLLGLRPWPDVKKNLVIRGRD